MRMVLQKVSEIVCLYCGTKKNQVEAIEQCPNCGAFANKVHVITVDKGYQRLDTRRPFAEDNRQQNPV